MLRQFAEFKAAREGLLDAFPDIQVEVEATSADGNHVVVRWRARGTHLGAGLGLPATGGRVDFRGMTWLTFKKRRHRRGLGFLEPRPAARVTQMRTSASERTRRGGS
jgi:predicted ester cyclase